MAVEWTNMYRDIWQTALQVTPSAVVPRSLGWGLICLWQSCGVSGAAYKIPLLWESISHDDGSAWSLSPVPASGKQKKKPINALKCNPWCNPWLGHWEYLGNERGAGRVKKPSHSTVTLAVVLWIFTSSEENQFSYSELRSRKWGVRLSSTPEIKDKSKMSSNWGSFYSCSGNWYILLVLYISTYKTGHFSNAAPKFGWHMSKRTEHFL